ncbi:outer membrane lipoprotein-sorting protein [Aeromonas cavernicola]|uniref:Outer membrane lipoprotein-sorting protein n=1 Tax=Aeromonas cavernicola TaxID=1006623 RepID=A0A2H9U086_9GAMM|nr:outer membrane lipoprotein-sorting protein [Aeromonas cavernicola]PJG57466.1 outer membrane lipoprotein-sorting protein [Aeromonas cavernicola]
MFNLLLSPVAPARLLAPSRCLPLPLAWLLMAAPVLADNRSLLEEADGYRLPSASAKVEALVEQYRADTLDKQRQYTVYLKPDRRSLVLMKSPSEAGQKVLMLADKFWLFMPASQRPIRITAAQKLVGDASTGDIANMTWSGDYQVNHVADAPCPQLPAAKKIASLAAQEPTSTQCLKVELAAALKGVTYAKVVLYLARENKLPIQADLYVSSGKKAKEAWYYAKELAGRTRISDMVLFDEIQPERYTVIHYQTITPKAVPDELFNPAALVRNTLQQW